jgi:hypothetical protein
LKRHAPACSRDDNSTRRFFSHNCSVPLLGKSTLLGGRCGALVCVRRRRNATPHRSGMFGEEYCEAAGLCVADVCAVGQAGVMDGWAGVIISTCWLGRKRCIVCPSHPVCLASVNGDRRKCQNGASCHVSQSPALRKHLSFPPRAGESPVNIQVSNVHTATDFSPSHTTPLHPTSSTSCVCVLPTFQTLPSPSSTSRSHTQVTYLAAPNTFRSPPRADAMRCCTRVQIGLGPTSRLPVHVVC